ncbi:MAG: CARDB domain-containing protein, partial [Planctomycetota bacterium]
SFAADDVNVVLREGDTVLGREVMKTITAGSNATASFTWVPVPGNHKLTFEASNEVPEMQYENNLLTHPKKVPDKPVIPSFGIWTVLAAMACIVVATRMRSRQR